MATAMSETYEGGCHCGALRWNFRTDVDPAHWVIRSCQCSFCRTHGARCTSDPSGTVEFFASDRRALSRYRFGLKTADFLICKKCGLYIGAILDGPNGCFATLNINSMKTLVEGMRDAVPASYDSEEKDDRLERRQTKWTPVTTAI